MNPIQVVTAADLHPIFPSVVQTHNKELIQNHMQTKVVPDQVMTCDLNNKT